MKPQIPPLKVDHGTPKAIQHWPSASRIFASPHDRNQRGSFFYNACVKTWDVIVVGGGIIGLSLARELRKYGAEVLVVERGEPGREASHAAGGMLANCGDETPAALQPLAQASARNVS